MKLSDYEYNLPKELVAQHPLKVRDQSKLLVLNRYTGEIQHRYFSDIVELFKPGDTLVLNDTRVFKARLKGKKETGGSVEMLLVREIEKGKWETLVHSSKRMPIGGKIFFDENNYATIENKMPGRCIIRLNAPARVIIKKFGIVPLPHYIRRATIPDDEEDYQTVYAKTEGSIAAPTAGLHFTSKILNKINQKGVKIARLTLHIGPGTFKPIRTHNIESHVMDHEYAELSKENAESINAAEHVIGVGTSVTRALESITRSPGSNTNISAFSGFTELFIYPGHSFRIIDHLITNFHLPCSTPLLLVCAFAGKELIFKAYYEAIKRNYRFLSYGDSMMIL